MRALVVLALSAGLAVAQPADDAQVMLDAAKHALDTGDTAGAAQQLGALVAKFPQSPLIAAAGDLWLDALVRAKDMVGVEAAARTLLKLPAFASQDAHARLEQLVADAMRLRAEALATADKARDAGELYLRIADEFPHAQRLDEVLYNAGMSFERAHDPRAVDAFRRVPAATPKSKLVLKAWFSAARLDEDWEPARAADEYMRAVAVGCDQIRCYEDADALYNAALLFMAVGEHAKAITALAIYVKSYPGNTLEADAAAFQIGIFAEQAGDFARARDAFEAYTTDKRHQRQRDAWLHAGKAAARLGQVARAQTDFANARAWSRHDGDQAEADFELAEVAARGVAKVAPSARGKDIERVAAMYNAIAGDPKRLPSVQWAVAARDREAHLYDDYGRELVALPERSSASTGTLDQVRAAREELDARATTARDTAARLYIAASDLAMAAELLTPYALDARTQLARLHPNGFPPEREARMHFRDEPELSPIVVLQPRP